MSPSRALPSLLTIAIAASLTISTGAFAADAKSTDKPAVQAAAAPFTAANPFYAQSKLQYQTPAFDKIKDSDYAPAIEEGMRQQRKEMDAIANNKAPPTFDNTIVAMERSGRLLFRVQKVFFNLGQSNNNDTIDKIKADVTPKLSKHQDSIFLDSKLFARVQAIYDQRDKLHLDPESYHLVEKYQENFILAGAKLNDADKAKVSDINARLATLTTEFEKRLLDGVAASAIVVDNKAELDGMSDADIAAAAQAATEQHKDGKYLIPLQNHSDQDVLSSLKNRALRERIMKASLSRGDVEGPYDTRPLIAEIAQLRAQRAALLGFKNHAAYAITNQMAHNPEAATDLMTRVAAPAVAQAHAEAAKIQNMINEEAAKKHAMGFRLQPWDWDFYAEQVRKAEYDLDESQIKPYFELDRVLHDGVFFAAHELYGLTFVERKDLPVYQPDVRVFEIFDENKKSIALFYCDYYARSNKQGGAWMDTFVDQSDLIGTRPVIVNVTNFTKPVPGQPTLLSFDDVTTMFHEFGHGLHGLLSKTKYPLFAGTSTPRDFVEFPSQFNENWALEPKVFANYAKNYKTGAPMPAELVAKIKKSGTFNQGHDTTEYLESALLDIAWHSLPADAPRQDADKFEADALNKYGVAVDEVPPRYRSAYFKHMWSEGYDAGYYAYVWTAVLAQDAFAWFNEHGGMTRANGQHFEDTVLSRGGTKDVHQLYLDFRGKEPSVEPYLEKKGLTAKPVDAAAPAKK
ncbi:MAG TPA: M3 family metallopeptidase [Xanthomonadaceae bacterium]|nr:M3 family metallopeptidase [Xanthomonadaceae bacterium]